jgi:hypothetical protein
MIVEWVEMGSGESRLGKGYKTFDFNPFDKPF